MLLRFAYNITTCVTELQDLNEKKFQIISNCYNQLCRPGLKSLRAKAFRNSGKILKNIKRAIIRVKLLMFTRFFPKACPFGDTLMYIGRRPPEESSCFFRIFSRNPEPTPGKQGKKLSCPGRMGFPARPPLPSASGYRKFWGAYG